MILVSLVNSSAQVRDSLYHTAQHSDVYGDIENVHGIDSHTVPTMFPFHQHVTLGYSVPAMLPMQVPMNGWMIQADFTDRIVPRRTGVIHIRSENNEVHEGSIHITEPAIWNSAIDISIGAILRHEETLYTTYKGDLHIRYPLTNIFSVTALLGYEHVSQGAAATVYQSNNVRLMAILEYDGQLASLRDGVSLRAQLSPAFIVKNTMGENAFDPNRNASNTVFELSGSSELLMRTFSDDLIFQPSIAFGWLYSGTRQLQQTDMFALGGRYSLRGYYESEFSPTVFVFTSLDYQWAISPIFTLTGFGDLGYVRTENTIAFEDESFVLSDVGLSLDVIFSFGVFTPMIAVPLTESSNSKFYLTYSHEL